MSCWKWRRKIQMHVQSELLSRTKLQLTMHLAKCPACRKEEKALAALEDSLNALEMEEVPEGLGTRIMANIRERMYAEIPTRGNLRLALSPALPGALLVVILTALAVWILGSFMGGGPESPGTGCALATSLARTLDSLTLAVAHHIWPVTILLVLYTVLDEIPFPGLRPRISPPFACRR